MSGEHWNRNPVRPTESASTPLSPSKENTSLESKPSTSDEAKEKDKPESRQSKEDASGKKQESTEKLDSEKKVAVKSSSKEQNFPLCFIGIRDGEVGMTQLPVSAKVSQWGVESVAK